MHKAFGLHFVTFLVAFAVMCSGITSASTASRAFAANFGAMISVVREEWMGGAPFEPSDTLTTVLAVIFISLIAAINLRGVAGSVKTNVVLTCVELTGLLIVIFVGFFAITQGRADLSRAVILDTRGGSLDLRGGYCRDNPGLLRDGRFRGLGQHGRGGQGA